MNAEKVARAQTELGAKAVSVTEILASDVDLGPQFAVVMGKTQLSDKDFDAAHALITSVVMKSLRD